MPTIIFKATEACNCRCAYCDVVARRSPRTISRELMATTFARVNDFLESHPEERMDIVWHGGEPLMAGNDTYRYAQKLIAELCEGTRDRIAQNMQTNLTMLTADTIDMLREMGIDSVGTSYDFCDGVRGLGAGRDTKAYNRRFFEAINMLDDHGMGWAFIYVVTRRVIDDPEGTFYHLLNLSPRGQFNLNPVLVYEGADEAARATALTAREYADFLGKVFALWFERRHYLAGVEPFQYLLDYCEEGREPGVCTESIDCGDHIYIGPDGELSQCGRAADWNLIDYGNIADRSIEDVLGDATRARLNKRHEWLRAGDCRGCRLWNVCHGGCPLDAYKSDIFTRKSTGCEWLKIFVKEYFEPVTGYKITSDEESDE